MFDRIRRGAHKIVNRVFGSTAVWVSEDTQVSFTGLVLFNDPTVKDSVDGLDFTTTDPYMEYLSGTFIELKPRVDRTDSAECVTIDGLVYRVTGVDKLDDGRIMKAWLQPVINGSNN